jgi:protease-4
MPELRRHQRLQLSGERPTAFLTGGYGDAGERGVVPDATCLIGAPTGTLRAPSFRVSRRRRVCSGLLLGALLALPGCISLQFFGGLPKPLEEKVLSGERGPKVLLVKVDGVISLRPPKADVIGPVRDSPVSRLVEALDQAREDPQVEALVLRIDSPGGTATASDVAYQEVLRFKRERDLPVVAHMIGTATSGGYYLAMAADTVVAHPTTVTGSIGAIFLGVSLAGLMEKLGIEDQTIVAGVHKNAASPLRRMTRGERAHFQSVLDDLHGRFQRVVEAGRPGLDAAQVAALSDGRIFTATQARERGLVDEVGDLELAVDRARERAGLTESRLVTYHRPREYENNLYTRTAVQPVLKLELPAPFTWLERPGFYYLWAPGIQ